MVKVVVFIIIIMHFIMFYQGWESIQHSQVSILRGREGKRGEVIILVIVIVIVIITVSVIVMMFIWLLRGLE